MDDILKTGTVRLPIALYRVIRRGAPWHADLDTGNPDRVTPFAAQGRTEADARAALTELITAALARWAYQPVLVIGGGPDYATWLHLILPQPHGWVVHAVRDGQPTGTWHTDHDRDELLQQVRDHVGGEPTVIVL